MGQYNDYYNINSNDTIGIFYPVGTVYETSDENFDPAVAWGGSWSKISNNEAKDRYIMAAGNNYNGSGGLASITLTENNIPSHAHYFTPESIYEIRDNNGNVTQTIINEIAPPTGTRSYTGAAITGYCHGFNVSGSVSGVFSIDNWGNSMRERTTIGAVRFNFYYKPEGTINGGTFSFTGETGDTGDKGSGSSFELKPPYKAVYIWERTA